MTVLFICAWVIAAIMTIQYARCLRWKDLYDEEKERNAGYEKTRKNHLSQIRTKDGKFVKLRKCTECKHVKMVDDFPGTSLRQCDIMNQTTTSKSEIKCDSFERQ